MVGQRPICRGGRGKSPGPLENNGLSAVIIDMQRPTLGLAFFAPFVLSLALAVPPAQAAYAPRVAVVLCQDTYDVADLRGYAQSSSQALVGLAGLVGTPYETVMLNELLARPAGAYTSVWFSNCSVLTSANVAAVASFLGAHLAQGGSVLLDGPIGAYAPPAAAGTSPMFRGSSDTAAILNVEAVGWEPVSNWVVRTTSTAHPLATLPGWAAGTALTQGLADGTDIIRIANAAQAGAHTLLEMGNGADKAAYLVTTQPGGAGKGRVLAISTFANDSGAATPFRNEQPRGFFDNQLMPRLIDATTWLLSPDEPAVGLLLSHAPMTAIVRLDADQSGSPEATAAALEYLVRLGRETGVTTAYAIVSSFAQGSNWASFAPLAPEIEQLGGALGSHSHTHNDNMSTALSDGDWDVEVRQSLALVRDHFTSATFHPAAKVFINPGNEIEWGDYRRFFKDIETYFTHGYETRVPYASGLSGFDLPAGTKPVALFSDSPAPDFQWFYDANWDYTVAAGTSYQKQILGYFQNRLGRGALYNQMWHDYAINNDPPSSHPSNVPLLPFFDAVRDHFAAERIFAPGISEVTAKFHLAQRALFTAQTSAGTVTTTFDLSRLTADQRTQLSGMGLRVQAAKPIVSVTINGAAHPAFTADTVILPPTQGAALTVVAQTGDAAATTPRLTYLSKAYAALVPGADSLRVDIGHPGPVQQILSGPARAPRGAGRRPVRGQHVGRDLRPAGPWLVGARLRSAHLAKPRGADHHRLATAHPGRADHRGHGQPGPGGGQSRRSAQLPRDQGPDRRQGCCHQRRADGARRRQLHADAGGGRRRHRQSRVSRPTAAGGCRAESARGRRRGCGRGRGCRRGAGRRAYTRRQWRRGQRRHRGHRRQRRDNHRRRQHWARQPAQQSHGRLRPGCAGGQRWFSRLGHARACRRQQRRLDGRFGLRLPGRWRAPPGRITGSGCPWHSPWPSPWSDGGESAARETDRRFLSPQLQSPTQGVSSALGDATKRFAIATEDSSAQSTGPRTVRLMKPRPPRTLGSSPPPCPRQTRIIPSGHLYGPR